MKILDKQWKNGFFFLELLDFYLKNRSEHHLSS